MSKLWLESVEDSLLEHCRKEALRKWKEESGPGATYGNLLRIFVKARHLDCADALCDMLRKKCEPCPVLTRIMCCDVCPSLPPSESAFGLVWEGE